MVTDSSHNTEKEYAQVVIKTPQLEQESYFKTNSGSEYL